MNNIDELKTQLADKTIWLITNDCNNSEFQKVQQDWETIKEALKVLDGHTINEIKLCLSELNKTIKISNKYWSEVKDELRKINNL